MGSWGSLWEGPTLPGLGFGGLWSGEQRTLGALWWCRISGGFRGPWSVWREPGLRWCWGLGVFPYFFSSLENFSHYYAKESCWAAPPALIAQDKWMGGAVSLSHSLVGFRGSGGALLVFQHTPSKHRGARFSVIRHCPANLLRSSPHPLRTALSTRPQRVSREPSSTLLPPGTQHCRCRLPALPAATAAAGTLPHSAPGPCQGRECLHVKKRDWN